MSSFAGTMHRYPATFMVVINPSLAKDDEGTAEAEHFASVPGMEEAALLLTLLRDSDPPLDMLVCPIDHQVNRGLITSNHLSNWRDITLRLIVIQVIPRVAYLQVLLGKDLLWAQLRLEDAARAILGYYMAIPGSHETSQLIRPHDLFREILVQSIVPVRSPTCRHWGTEPAVLTYKQLVGLFRPTFSDHDTTGMAEMMIQQLKQPVEEGSDLWFLLPVLGRAWFVQALHHPQDSEEERYLGGRRQSTSSSLWGGVRARYGYTTTAVNSFLGELYEHWKTGSSDGI